MWVRTARVTRTATAGMAVGVAVLRLVVSLALFVLTIAAFLVAPLLLLGVALLTYLLVRPHPSRRRPGPSTLAPGTPGTAAHGFGSGAR